MSGKTLNDARAELEAQARDSEDVRAFVEFMDRSERALVR
jgi:UDP-N-acetylglucosamine acyltransferase